jgi:hypothetical protein
MNLVVQRTAVESWASLYWQILALALNASAAIAMVSEQLAITP